MATVTVIFWGASFAGAKIALEQASPLMVMFLRFVFSLIILLPVAFFCGELKLPSAKQALVLAFMGFMGFFFHIGIQTVAMQTSGSATANWQMAAAPAITAMLASVFLKEKLRRDAAAGIVLAFVGVMLVLGLGTSGASGLAAYTFGDFLISLSVLNWAAFMVLTRLMVRNDSFGPVFTIFWEMFFAVVLSIPALWLMGEKLSVVSSFSLSTWSALAMLGFLCSGIAYVFWYYAASRLPIAQLMVFQFLQPFIGVLVAYFVIGERFTLWLFSGGALIIFGVWLVNRPEKSQTPRNMKKTAPTMQSEAHR